MHPKVLREPINFIVTNLAVADLLRAIECGVMTIPSNATGYIFLGKWYCQFDGYVVSVFGE